MNKEILEKLTKKEAFFIMRNYIEMFLLGVLMTLSIIYLVNN